MLALAHRRFALDGPSEIENLQRALINLSIATQRPAINTQVTGTVTDSTMLALSAALGLLTEELPSWLYLGLQGATMFGATNSTAKKYVGEYATQLALAINTAAVKYKQTPPVPAPPAPVATQPSFFAPGWYKTPIGVALIAVVAFVGYKLLIAPSKKA